MVNRAKQRGTAAETAVVNYLRSQGFPLVERRALAGSLDKGDISGLLHCCVEVKDQVKLTFGPWLKESQVETVNAKARWGWVWAKRKGFTDPADWYVLMDGRTLTDMLTAAFDGCGWKP